MRRRDIRKFTHSSSNRHGGNSDRVTLNVQLGGIYLICAAVWNTQHLAYGKGIEKAVGIDDRTTWVSLVSMECRNFCVSAVRKTLAPGKDDNLRWGGCVSRHSELMYSCLGEILNEKLRWYGELLVVWIKCGNAVRNVECRWNQGFESWFRGCVPMWNAWIEAGSIDGNSKIITCFEIGA